MLRALTPGPAKHSMPLNLGMWTRLSGVAMCAAFTMGVLMGGLRPRTLTAIRLKDLSLFVVTERLLAKGSTPEKCAPALSARRRSTELPVYL